MGLTIAQAGQRDGRQGYAPDPLLADHPDYERPDGTVWKRVQ